MCAVTDPEINGIDVCCPRELVHRAFDGESIRRRN